MLSEPTLEKLREMRLTAMAKALEEQRRDPKIHELDFDERFGLLVDAEHLARKNRKLTNLLRRAQLRISDACVEDLECSSERGLIRSVAHQLGSCRFVVERANLLITGKTGVGKTYVACALAQQACRRGHRTLYRRLTRLLDEIALSRADGSWPKLLRLLSRTEVLVLDDFGLTPLSSTKRHDLLEIFEEGEGRSSTIVTSQLPQKAWHEYLGEPTVADAILDRVVHNAYKVKLKGPSKRKEKKGKKES
jgi:DNA replication protein DnaC